MICENTSKVPYAVKVSDPNDEITWTVTGGREIYTPSTGQNKDLTRQVDWTLPGIDTIFVMADNHACTKMDSLIGSVSAHAKPNFIWEIPGGLTTAEFINSTEQPIISEGDSTIEVPFKNFSWNFGRETDIPYPQSNESYLAEEKIEQRYKYGYYDVTLRSESEYCIDSATKQIFIDLQEGLYVPNSFVPESKSPGLAKFQPKGFNIETYKIWIYDTWGNLMWYSDKLINGQPLEGWDGTYNGITAKLDSYVWKVEATFLDGTKWEGQASSTGSKKSTYGNVLLLR